jgi:hypothetical protein
MTVRILADYHHADLWESLEMLFTDRFGWELYRPTGLPWLTEGFWRHEVREWWEKGGALPAGPDDVKVREADAVPRQYLEPWGTDVQLADHAERQDLWHPGRTIKMVTLEQARSQPWDIVLATLVENEPGLWQFAQERGAHFGIQIGNQWAENFWRNAEFGLASTTLPFVPDRPHVFYHQEFSLQDFRYEYPPVTTDTVRSWVQCLPDDGPEYGRFKRLAGLSPELAWGMFSHCGGDGYWIENLRDTSRVAATMRETRVGVHFKTWSDGYGHVIHNLFATGKPVIATATYYLDKLAGPLFVDGVTSFNVQTRSDEEVVAIIRRLVADDDFHSEVSHAAAARFREVVSFDEDAEKVRGLLEGVLS